MAKTLLPPGYRFHPTDVELIKYYLKRKVMGRNFRGSEDIAEVDIYKYAPWDLPAKSCLRSGDLKWYFFCPREKKHPNGARMNRATECGYWKTTGKDRPVRYNNDAVGMIKTLVFHRGKAPRGERTDWVMHEYRIEEKNLADRGVAQDAYVLCMVFQKDGPGPRNGAQYGAPFKEEEWDDDEDVNYMEIGSSSVHSIPLPIQTSPVAASSSCLSDATPSAYNALSPIPENNGVSSEVDPVSHEPDIVSMLDIFTEDSTLVLNTDVQNENFGNKLNENIETSPHSDGIDIYNDLGDLGNLGGLGESVSDSSFSGNADYSLTQSLLGDAPLLELLELDAPFLELRDLDAPLNGPAEAGAPGLIHTTNELYPNQNCYNSEQSCTTVNPRLSQLPSMLPEHYRVENPLITYMENGPCGNVQLAPLNHGDATIFNPLPTGSNHSSEDLIGGGFHYPV